MTDPRPLFTNLGELAAAITYGIRNAEGQGMKAKAVHANPKMKEVMDSLAGYTIKTIGAFPVVANPQCPIDRFIVEKA